MLSWINTLPEILSANHSPFIIDFFEWVVDPLLEFVRKNCKVSQCIWKMKMPPTSGVLKNMKGKAQVYTIRYDTIYCLH